jgi:hypothetical protein
MAYYPTESAASDALATALYRVAAGKREGC